MIKELPINQNPFLKTYQYFALPIAALMNGEHTNSTMLYLINNFNQIQYCYQKRRLDFWSSRFIYWDCVDVQNAIRNDYLIQSTTSIIEVIRFAVKNNLYVYTNVNEFYINNRRAYQNFYKKHDILVYGYTNNCILTFGYDNKGMLSKNEVLVKDFECAFNTISEPVIVYLFKFAEYNEISLNTHKISEHITDYIFSINSDLKYDFNNTCERYCYGIEAAKKSISIEIDKINNNQAVDIRNIDCFLEYKRLMLKRIELLGLTIEVKSLLDEYHSLYDDAMIIKNYFLKVQNSNRVNNIEGILNIFEYDIVREKELLTQLVQLLNMHNMSK